MHGVTQLMYPIEERRFKVFADTLIDSTIAAVRNRAANRNLFED
jgi:hypothetical protein